jgi:DNA-binding MarR family transcriptional regulator
MCQTGAVDDQFSEVTAMARAVKRAGDALVEAVRVTSNPAGGPALRAAHAQVFEHLDPGGTRVTALAERARMTHQAMGELVADLEQAGLVERVTDPADRRARLVRPTAAGQAVLARAGARLRVLHDRWARELDGVSVAQVVQALGILIRICEEPRS